MAPDSGRASPGDWYALHIHLSPKNPLLSWSDFRSFKQIFSFFPWTRSLPLPIITNMINMGNYRTVDP